MFVRYIYIRLTEIRSLDSEMQTLLYENYNKIISLTETIRNILKIKYTTPLGLYVWPCSVLVPPRYSTQFNN